MEFLEETLKLVPSEWQHETYTGKRFVLVTVDPDTDEYNSLINDLKSTLLSKTIISVQRIQHPFAYGRFMLHKEQLEQQGHLVVEKRECVLFKGDLSRVTTFIDYNCDMRRKVSSCGDNYIIVKQVLSHLPERDTNWYPEYLLQYE